MSAKKKPHLVKKRPCNFVLSLLGMACLSKGRVLEALVHRRRPGWHGGSKVTRRGGLGWVGRGAALQGRGGGGGRDSS